MFSKTLLLKHGTWLLIIGILFLSIVLRFWQLGKIPEGFHLDEAAYGYNAYSLLKTGKDEYGQPFPLILKSFNDYKGALYAYVTIPFVYLFGLNEWSVRAPSALFGVFFVLLTYALVHTISNNRTLAIISMALATFSPVGILLSRVQSDPLLCVFFFYFGYYCWIRWTKKQNMFFFALSIASVVMSFYTYPSSRLFVLPFFVFIGLRHWHTWNKHIRISAVIAFFGIGILVGSMMFSNAGARFSQLSVFSTMNVQLPLEEGIREDGITGVPILATRAVHNKVMAYGQYFLDNFAGYLSYDFLFRQATQPLREQVPNAGIALLVELPFLLLGIYTAFKKRLRYAVSAVIWFFLVPAILSVASDETPNVHRFFLAMIPFHLLVALGIIQAYENVRAKLQIYCMLGICIVLIVNEGYYLHQLFAHQPTHNPIYRMHENKELSFSLKELYPLYDIIVSQKILEQILFYWQVDPAIYQQQGSPRDYDNAWYDKFLFVTDACPSRRMNPAIKAITANRILYVDRAECSIDSEDTVVRTISFGNTLPAYYIVEKGSTRNR
jgi:4-amino-4-deoxy-L-arabinose transferase-like glycosyltransferase